MPRKGSAGPRKSPGQAVDKRNGQKITLRPRQLKRFDPPGVLGERAREAWDGYWDDPVSELATPADKTLLIRWIGMVERYEMFLRMAMAEPQVRGSTGQPMVNGFFNAAKEIEIRIALIEAQLGIGPKNRAALGIAVLSEQRSLADLNAEYEQDGGELDGDEDEDPRILPGSVEG